MFLFPFFNFLYLIIEMTYSMFYPNKCPTIFIFTIFIWGLSQSTCLARRRVARKTTMAVGIGFLRFAKNRRAFFFSVRRNKRNAVFPVPHPYLEKLTPPKLFFTLFYNMLQHNYNKLLS